MTIANPRVHLICGVCGKSGEFVYEIVRELTGADDDALENVVYLSCNNCATLTGLGEIVTERG